MLIFSQLMLRGNTSTVGPKPCCNWLLLQIDSGTIFRNVGLSAAIESSPSNSPIAAPIVSSSPFFKIPLICEDAFVSPSCLLLTYSFLFQENPLEIHRVDSYQQVASHPCHSWIWWKGDGECHLKLWLWSLILNGEVQVHWKCTHWMSGVLLLCKWLAVSLTCLEEQTTMTTRTIDAAGTAWSMIWTR